MRRKVTRKDYRIEPSDLHRRHLPGSHAIYVSQPGAVAALIAAAAKGVDIAAR